MSDFLISSERLKANLIKSLNQAKQELEIAQIKNLYLEGVNARSYESRIFLSNELIKITDSFDNISMSRKLGELVN